MGSLTDDLAVQIKEDERKTMLMASKFGDLTDKGANAAARSFGSFMSFGLQDEIVGTYKTLRGEGEEGESFTNRLLENIDRQSDYEDELSKQNPVAGILGAIPGAIASSLTAAGIASKVLKMSPKGLAFLKYVRSGFTPRVISTAAIASVEAGVYATFEGRPIIADMGVGAQWGAVGQAVLGDLLPGVWRAVFRGKRPTNYDKHRAKEALFKRLKEENPDLIDNPKDLDMLWDMYGDKLRSLGPEAILADMSDLILRDMLGLLKDPKFVQRGESFSKIIARRIRNEGDNFNDELETVLSPVPAKSLTEIEEQASRNFKVYATMMDEALTKSRYRVNFNELVADIVGAFSVKGLTSPASKREIDTLIRVLKDNAVQADGSAAFKNGKLIKGAIVKPFTANSVKDLVHILDTSFITNLSNVKGQAEVLDQLLNKQLSTLRKVLVQKLDAGVDGHASLRRTYAATHALVKAHKLGVDIFNSGPLDDVTALQSRIGAYELPEQTALLNGIKWAMEDALLASKDGGAIIKTLSEVGNVRGKLTAVLGPSTADALIDAATASVKLKSVNAASKNARNTGLTTPQQSLLSQLTDLTIAGAGILSPIVSSAAGIGAGRRVIINSRGGAGPRIDRAFSNLVAENTGPNAQRLLNNLRNFDKVPPPKDLGDTIANTAGLLSSVYGAYGNQK